MGNISLGLIAGFVITTLATILFFYRATKSTTALLIIIFWMGITAILGLKGFYQDYDASPPRFILLLPPGVAFVIIFSVTPKGKSFIQRTTIKWLTLLHTVRVPVEFVLYYAFLQGLIPELMTFDGYNFDIISGISAPIIFYLCFIKKRLNNKHLLIWNYLCLGLLTNILTIALLSAKTPFQQLAFHQPNIGVTFFPFVWLPAVIVPLVLFSHIASIQHLRSSL